MKRRPRMTRWTRRRGRHRAAYLLAGLALCVATLSACAQAPAIATESVHFGDQIKHLMRRMNTLVHERNLSELEVDRERLERAHELAAAATALAAEAGVAGDSAPGMNDAQRREFVRLAHALATEAAVLDELATAGRYGELSVQMQRVGDQCVACHRRFGVNPG